MTSIMICASLARSLINFRGPLIRELGTHGHAVYVVAPNIDYEVRRQLQSIGCFVHELQLHRQGTGIISDLWYFLNLLSLMQRVRPDLVLTYTIKPNIWGALASWCCGIRSVSLITGLGYTFIETRSYRQRLSRRIAAILYRLATSCNSLVVFQNADDRNDFIAAGCLADRSKARLVNGTGVDCDHYSQTLLPDAPVFLMIARLLGNKGVREYGEAVVRLKQSRPQTRCLLVGFFDKGPDSIKAAELETWIQGGLEYLGRMEDVRPALASCSVYVLPSYREGTPRSVLEAMATGRAIITSDAPGCRETVVDGLNGFLVPVKDVKFLVTRMTQLVDNPKLRSQMARESLRIVREKYDAHAVNRALIGHLGDVDSRLRI